LHLVEAPTNEQQPPPARDEDIERRNFLWQFPLFTPSVLAIQGEEMIGESVAKFWAVGSRSEYASRLGV
jgi:hypothetical protein